MTTKFIIRDPEFPWNFKEKVLKDKIVTQTMKTIDRQWGEDPDRTLEIKFEYLEISDVSQTCFPTISVFSTPKQIETMLITRKDEKSLCENEFERFVLRSSLLVSNGFRSSNP